MGRPSGSSHGTRPLTLPCCSKSAYLRVKTNGILSKLAGYWVTFCWWRLASHFSSFFTLFYALKKRLTDLDRTPEADLSMKLWWSCNLSIDRPVYLSLNPVAHANQLFPQIWMSPCCTVNRWSRVTGLPNLSKCPTCPRSQCQLPNSFFVLRKPFLAPKFKKRPPAPTPSILQHECKGECLNV